MAGENSVLRKQTEVEKADYLGLTNQRPSTILNVFSANLAKVQAKYQKLHRPYDTFGARMDFEAGIREQTGDSSMMDRSAEGFEFKTDLEKYGNPDRFEYMGVENTMDDKLLDGMRQTVVVGKYFEFKGKTRRNGISVFVSKEDVPEMEKWIAEHFGEKKEVIVSEDITVPALADIDTTGK